MWAAYLAEISVYPVRDAEGQVTHFAAIQRDVTKEKQAEAILREGDERFRNMLQNAPNGWKVSELSQAGSPTT